MWGNCVFVKECKEKNKFFKFAWLKNIFWCDSTCNELIHLFTYCLIDY